MIYRVEVGDQESTPERTYWASTESEADYLARLLLSDYHSVVVVNELDNSESCWTIRKT